MAAASSSSYNVQDSIQQIRESLATLGDALNSSGVKLPPNAISRLDSAMQEVNNLGNGTGLIMQERDQYRSLADTAALVNSTLDLTVVLNGVMDIIIQLTEAERGFLMLREEDTGELTFRIARNMEKETLDETDFTVSRSIMNRVAETGKPVVMMNAPEEEGASESIIMHDLRSILCVPLKLEDQVTGVIYADNRIRKGLFNDADRDLLTAFANLAAVAIRNAQLFASVNATLEAISEMKNLQDNIFASITSGVITTDRNNNVTLINQAAASIFNLEKGIAPGTSLSSVLPPLEAGFDDILKEVGTTDKPVVGIEWEPEIPGRGSVNLNMSLSPLKDAHTSIQGIAIVLNDVTAEKRRKAQLRGVQRYLPKEVIDNLTNVDALKLGGTRQVISILFADIRGFSTYSEKVSPEHLVEVINAYFTIAAEAIHLQEGVIDKFMGDAVMALFNPSIRPQPDHALRAVRAALSMRTDFEAYNETLAAKDRLGFGIGVHTGDAVTGNIGSEERLEYSALGDSVNLSKRLQEESGPGQVLISDATYQQVKGKVAVNKLDPIQVKGRSEYTQIYELLSISN